MSLDCRSNIVLKFIRRNYSSRYFFGKFLFSVKILKLLYFVQKIERIAIYLQNQALRQNVSVVKEREATV